MQLEALLWLFLPVFVAGGSALLSYYVMQARMEVALAKERETLAEARAMINSHKVTLEERVKATEEACKRQALDDFMHDIRVEERSYVREQKSLNSSRKTMVMQERIFFRNIPLSNWIEREMVVEDGQDTRQIAADSIFTAPALATTVEAPLGIAKLLNEVKGRPEPVLQAGGPKLVPRVEMPRDLELAAAAPLPERVPETPVMLTQHATAFGAQ